MNNSESVYFWVTLPLWEMADVFKKWKQSKMCGMFLSLLAIIIYHLGKLQKQSESKQEKASLTKSSEKNELAGK